MNVAYIDFGPPTIKPKGHGVLSNPRYLHRPYCELCGPFRGRHLRRAGGDEFGAIYRCRACDDES